MAINYYYLSLFLLLILPSLNNGSSICEFANQSKSSKIQCQCRTNDSVICKVKSADIKENDAAWSAALTGKGPFDIIDLIDEHGKLSFVPDRFFNSQKTAKSIIMMNAMLITLPALSFHNFSKLQSLLLSENEIRDMEENAFSDLPELTELNLASNKIELLREKCFVNLTKLNKLVLSNNELSVIENGAFVGVKNLKFLNLDHNKLTKLEQNWWTGLENIQTLVFRGNFIESLKEDSFGNMTSLNHLDLSKNSIMTINRGTFSGLLQLEILNLNENSLEAIVEDLFDGLKELRELYLRKNNMKIFSSKGAITIKNNFMNSNAFISATGNDFTCNCELRWMADLYEASASRKVREKLASVNCKTENETILSMTMFSDLKLICPIS